MSRTRTKNVSSGSVSTSWSYERFKDYDDDRYTDKVDHHSLPYTGSCIPLIFTKSMTDVVTPNFRKTVSKGGIVNSPMNSLTTTIMDPPADWGGSTIMKRDIQTRAIYNGWWTFTLTGTAPSSYFLSLDFPEFDLDPSAVRSQAITKAFSNISLSEANLVASLGEAKETIGSFVKLYRQIRRVIEKRLRKFTYSTYADAYMALRYELRPLYYEVWGYLNALQAANTGNFRRTFRGYAQDTEKKTVIRSKDVTLGFRIKTRIESQCVVRARAGVMTDIVGADWTDLVGLGEIPQGLWELVPFSFIIDWFTNVGKLIASWSPKPKFKTLASWVTTEVETTHTAVVDSVVPYPQYGVNGEDDCYKSPSFNASPTYTHYTLSKCREPNPSRPILPSFDVRLDFFKLLDLCIIIKNLC